MEMRLRVYDAALRFAQANHPKEASVFENCMAVVTAQPDLPDVFASPELDKLRGKARELFLRVVQDLGNPSNPEKAGKVLPTSNSPQGEK